MNQRSIDILSLLHHIFIEMGSKKHPNRPPADPGAPKWVENAPHSSPVGPQAPWDRFFRGKWSPFGCHFELQIQQKHDLEMSKNQPPTNEENETPKLRTGAKIESQIYPKPLIKFNENLGRKMNRK